MAALRLTISRQEETQPNKTHPPKKSHYLSRSFFWSRLELEKKRIKEAQIIKRATTLLGKSARGPPSLVEEDNGADLGSLEDQAESRFALIHQARNEAKKAFVHLDTSKRVQRESHCLTRTPLETWCASGVTRPVKRSGPLHLG